MLKSNVDSQCPPAQELPRRAATGFSLVETVIALGVFAFVLIPLIGLLPLGMQANSESRDETRAMGLMRHLLAERRAQPSTEVTSNGLPALDANPPLPQRTVSNTGSSTEILSWDDRRYRMNYSLQRPPLVAGAVSRSQPYLLHIRLSWPADSAAPQGFVESLASFTTP